MKQLGNSLMTRKPHQQQSVLTQWGGNGHGPVGLNVGRHGFLRSDRKKTGPRRTTSVPRSTYARPTSPAACRCPTAPASASAATCGILIVGHEKVLNVAGWRRYAPAHDRTSSAA